MATGTGNFPNRPFRLRVETWFNWQSGLSANIAVQLWIDKLSYSPTLSGSGSSWVLQIAGSTIASWSGGYNFVDGTNFLLHSGNYNTGLDINGDVHVAGFASFDILGYTEAHVVLDGTAATVPAAPSNIGIDQITQTGQRYRFVGNSDGGSGIIRWEYQAWPNSSFSGAGVATAPFSGTVVRNDLTPGTTYYWRSRGVNSVGNGPWSATISATTLPNTPPGVTVTPSPAGGSATVALTPPSGASGVEKYTVTYTYISPTPIPSPSTWTQETTSNSLVVTGLVPGATYRWTATATIGGSASPASANQDIAQPAPSTGAGDYFDGSTPAKTDTTYSWTGTTNNSTSNMDAQGVTGWTASALSGGSLIMMRATGGYAENYAARVVIKNDLAASKPSLRAGIDTGSSYRVDTEPNTQYYGSIYVNPSRQNLFSAEITWLSGAGAVLTRIAGTGTLAPAGTWTRLVVSATAPSNAEYAVVNLIDASGVGSSQIISGDVILGDAAMLSLGEIFTYFDGDTLDTAQYEYEWVGTPNQSQSRRISLDSTADLLVDPDCPPIPAPPRPPIVPSDCIADVGVWRRYWAYIPYTEVSDWLAVIPTLELRTSGFAERQVRIRVYPDPFNRDNTQIDAADFCSEQIISYIPPSSVVTLDGVTERVWAEVNGGSPISADHLLYGSNGTPAVWPRLSCGIGYWVSLDVPNDSPSGNLGVRVFLTQRT